MTSLVLHMECNIDTFNFIDEENFLIVSSTYGFENAPVALHLTSNQLLDVLWNPAQSITSLDEYYHELYYVLYNQAVQGGFV